MKEDLKMECNVCKRNVREHEKNCWWCGVSNPFYSQSEPIPEVDLHSMNHGKLQGK